MLMLLGVDASGVATLAVSREIITAVLQALGPGLLMPGAKSTSKQGT